MSRKKRERREEEWRRKRLCSARNIDFDHSFFFFFFIACRLFVCTSTFVEFNFMFRNTYARTQPTKAKKKQKQQQQHHCHYQEPEKKVYNITSAITFEFIYLIWLLPIVLPLNTIKEEKKLTQVFLILCGWMSLFSFFLILAVSVCVYVPILCRIFIAMSFCITKGSERL